ncbi:MAG: citrate/2-methylcitrate synthase [Deltaproteobacteria bacterium]|nr:citrate/2-methylcitrate synthase [Deltaproteobacteria bacterium]
MAIHSNAQNAHSDPPNALSAAAMSELEAALAMLTRVDVPDDLKNNVLARVSGEAGFMGFGRRQWGWAGLSFGAWMLLTQGMFSWMLGGMSAL